MACGKQYRATEFTAVGCNHSGYRAFVFKNQIRDTCVKVHLSAMFYNCVAHCLDNNRKPVGADMGMRINQYSVLRAVRVKYLHSDIDTLERAQIIRDMRLDVFDVLVGINLLREGLDIPEISLVAVLDADKEGFLRSATSLIQTVGRAARNAEGHVVMYADTITDSMQVTLDETARRRAIQQKYNEEHGITPQTIKKAVRDLISISKAVAKEEQAFAKDPESMNEKELKKLIDTVEKNMRKAAADLNFEAAMELRDKMMELKKQLQDLTGGL